MLRRTNNAVTRELYARMITLVTSSGNNDLLVVTNVTRRARGRETATEMLEMSQVIFHKTSGSYPLMISVKLSTVQFLRIIKVQKGFCYF